MMRFVTPTVAAALLGCGSAIAQVGGMSISPGTSPLGMTSPLGLGPGSPVAPTGIPLGAIELASPGVSPTTAGISPLGQVTGSATLCSGQTSSGPGSAIASALPGTGGSVPGTSPARPASCAFGRSS